MCLIAYVKAGKKLPKENFDSAADGNRDGIGIMSKEGVYKYLGRKMRKKAWRECERLHALGIDYAIHFRFATLGDVRLQNCHPFKTFNGRLFVMHNGTLAQYSKDVMEGKDEHTDSYYLTQDIDGNADVKGDEDYWKKVKEAIGSNKLCIMDNEGNFLLVNAAVGTWRDDIWYSQTYSLPRPAGANKGLWTTYKSLLDDDAAYGSHAYNWRGHLNAAYDRRGYGGAIGYDGGDSYRAQVFCTVCKAWYKDECDCKVENKLNDEDKLIDKAVEAAIAAEKEEAEEGNFICPSCETIHNNEPMGTGHVRCPSCGFIDMNDGMLDDYCGVAAK